MPQLRAAVVRSAPSSTSAIASIRRATFASLVQAASRRNPSEVKSSRVISTAVAMKVSLARNRSESDFHDLGIPRSHRKWPLV